MTVHQPLTNPVIPAFSEPPFGKKSAGISSFLIIYFLSDFVASWQKLLLLLFPFNLNSSQKQIPETSFQKMRPQKIYLSVKIILDNLYIILYILYTIIYFLYKIINSKFDNADRQFR